MAGYRRITLVLLFVLSFFVVGPGCARQEKSPKAENTEVSSANEPSTGKEIFSFIVACDMRKYAQPEYWNSDYFFGTCQAIAETGVGAFMISPGDIDPPWDVRAVLDSVIGKDYIWYPVVGNHERETPKDMEWLRSYNSPGNELPYIVNHGPEGCRETTFSFDYGNTHLVVINQYFAAGNDTLTDGGLSKELERWLVDDLEKNKLERVYVFGHEPTKPTPDIDSGRLRHEYDSLNQFPEENERFREILASYDVEAYFCGHTHNASIEKVAGTWQVDAGHCRGIGDKGAPSTYLRVRVYENNPGVIEVWRADESSGWKYEHRYTWNL